MAVDGQGSASEGSPAAGERFEIGARVDGTDGHCGELTRVVIDPVAQTLTHLVVDPKHRHELGKLVPIDLVDAVEGGERVRLSCTQARFHELDDAEEAQYLPGGNDSLGYGQQSLIAPYFGFEGQTDASRPAGHGPVFGDRVPMGEVEISRGDEVRASDGWIGSVHGLVIDPGTHHVSHVLLQEGHFWGRKQVAIPIGATARVGEEVQVDLTKEQVHELPEVKFSSHQ